MESYYLLDAEFQLEKMKVNGSDGYTTMWMSWIPWNYTFKNGENGQFYVYFTAIKNFFNLVGHTKSHWIVHCKWVNCMVCELSLNTFIYFKLGGFWSILHVSNHYQRFRRNRIFKPGKSCLSHNTFYVLPISLAQGFPMLVIRSAPSAASGDLLEMHSLRPYPTQTAEPETVCVGSSNLGFNKPSRWCCNLISTL